MTNISISGGRSSRSNRESTSRVSGGGGASALGAIAESSGGGTAVASSRPGVATSERSGRPHSASAQSARQSARKTQAPRTAAAIAKTSQKSKPDSDELLVERMRAGDRAAFDEIYSRYFKRVYGFLDRRLRNRADTEETTQEVFINVFSSLDGFRGEAPFAAWIFGLTRRTLAARFRRKRHPTVPLFDEDETQAISGLTAGSTPEASPLEQYEMNERADQLRRALEHEITEEQRRLFEMHHLESMPIAEIARRLAKSEDSVKSTLYRTRKTLLTR